jgi:hypothetical protein
VYGDELNMFGAYLDTRLRPERIWEKDGRKYNSVYLDGWLDDFDEWMDYRRGVRETAPKIRLKVPDEVRAILDELRRRDEDTARWIAFALLDTPDPTLDDLGDFLIHLRKHPPAHGMFRRTVFQAGDLVICLMGSLGISPTQLLKRTQQKAVIEKYRRKANKCLALSCPRQSIAGI